MQQIPLRVRLLHDRAVVPQYQSTLAAGMDLHAAVDAPIILEMHEIAIVPTGLAIELPAGWEAQIRPRSGLATKHGISIPNAPGTIDADYRGEIKVALINLGRHRFCVEPGMRIAQMVVSAVARCEIIIAEELVETARGAGGFGSTGD